MYLLVKMIKAALDKITSFREKALNTQDWSTLIPEDEEQVHMNPTSLLGYLLF